MDRAARFWRVAAAGWALLIFALSSIPGAAFPPSKLFTYDKLLHAAVYAVLGAFCFLALARGWSRKTSVLVLASGAMATLFGFTDEFHQMFVPGRFADLRDVLADGVGGFAGALATSALATAKVDSASPTKAAGPPAK